MENPKGKVRNSGGHPKKLPSDLPEPRSDLGFDQQTTSMLIVSGTAL